MIYLIAGATHTGKTAYAQKLLEKYQYPYLSIDHLKMGLIRSGNTEGKIEKDFFGRSTTPFCVVSRKAIVPTAEEIEANPRSRSAKMRVAEKL